MRHLKTSLAAVVVAGLLAATAALAAQKPGNLAGSVEDTNGKAWPNVSVTLDNTKTKAHFATKTDANGQFTIQNVPPGDYTLTFDTGVYPPEPFKVKIQAGKTLSEDLNFQKLIAKNPKLAAELKKAKQFVLLRKHFHAGVQAMNKVKSLQQQMNTEPTAKQSATQQQIAQLSQTAVTELQQAQKAAAPKDPNLPIILGNLGLAYQLSGKHDQAATTFTQAAQLKPTDAGLLMGAATNLAYSGKIKEASADCEKAVALSPQGGGNCWHNIGVVLYNTNQMKEAVGPLQKAAKVDPSNAGTWYLLGEALMNNMQSKMVNGKLTAQVQPGTAEAFHQYLKLAPNGPNAANAKQALQVLQQLSGGKVSDSDSSGGNKKR